jgi:ABC-2 type transport system permease protein
MVASTSDVQAGHARWTAYAPLDAGAGVRFQAATGDLAAGIWHWRTWTYLGLESIKNQYRRTVLGPLWLTLQTVAYVFGLGVIFGQIMHAPLREFLPYVAVGYIMFALLSGLTRASSQSFVAAAATMKSTRQPLSSLVLKDITIEFIQFGHNIVIFLAFVVLGLVHPNITVLIIFPVLVAIAVNGVFLGLWLGTAVARFRDVSPLVMSILQVLIFFTPVFYKTSDLTQGARHAFLDWNPFTYLLNAAREPLLGAPLTANTYIGLLVVTVVNVALGLYVFTRTRSRLPYWVA